MNLYAKGKKKQCCVGVTISDDNAWFECFFSHSTLKLSMPISLLWLHKGVRNLLSSEIPVPTIACSQKLKLNKIAVRYHYLFLGLVFCEMNSTRKEGMVAFVSYRLTQKWKHEHKTNFPGEHLSFVEMKKGPFPWCYWAKTEQTVSQNQTH